MPASRLSRLRIRAVSSLCGHAVLAGIIAAPAVAADLDPAPATTLKALSTVPDVDAPVFYATVYLWTSALNGTTSTLPPLPAANVDLAFGDILKHFDGGLMGTVEMRAGRWSTLIDAMFTQVSPGGTLPGPFASDVEVRSRSLTLQGNVLYRFYESDTVDIDVGAGVRLWHLGNRLSIAPGLLPLDVTVNETQSWVDPLVAGRFSARLGGPWSVTVVGDIGGFGVGSQLTWQIIGTVNYQWNEKLALRLGYRTLSVDYEDGAFLYDVRMQGPILGATYRF